MSDRTTEPGQPAAEAMRYPIAGVAGIFDQAIRWGEPDPYMDGCPLWCGSEPTGHPIESNDDDRCHASSRRAVVVRSITATTESQDDDNIYVLGTAQMYLEQRVLEREPTIWLGKGESGEGFKLSLSEVEDLARTLLDLLGEARP